MIQLHLAVLLFGLAGLFGKFLSLHPVTIVLGRTIFAAGSLLIFFAARKQLSELTLQRTVRSLPSGLLLAVHWVTFFQSIQISSVAVGLLSFATFPIFVTFLEPLVSRVKLRMIDVAVALVVFLGLVLIVPSYDFGNNVFQGVLWGLTSGFTFAILALYNRKIVQGTDPFVVGFFQTTWAGVCLAPFGTTALLAVSGREIALLAVLGVLCTAIAHSLFIAALKNVRAQLASITTGLEPIYGSILAGLLLSEWPSPREIIGGAVVLGAVCYASWKENKSS